MSHDCHVKAVCANTLGSYSCSCITGYATTDAGRTCDIINCTTLQDPKNGFKNGAVFSYESKVSFGCNKGYELSGTASVTCQADGTWTFPQPSCLDINECQRGSDDCHDQHGKCINTKGSYQCECLNGYEGDGVHCPPVQCPTLIAPVDGTKTGSKFTYGQAVVFGCHRGYQLYGSAQRTCQANKTWSGSKPVCKGEVVLHYVTWK